MEMPMKIGLYLLLLFLSLLSLLVFSNPYFVAIVLGIISSLIILLVDSIAGNLEYLKLSVVALRFGRKSIRISISYLFRIKVDDRYLLIQGKRFPQFQPIGGVFKRYDSSTNFFQGIEALDDDLLPIDEASRHDLRIRIKGKHLVKFMKWFDSRKNREICGWREFYEEVVKTDLFPIQLFPYIRYEFVKKHENPIRYSDYAQSYEILIAEIYELILDKDQEDFLRNTMENDIEDCIWATEEEILRRGSTPRKNYNFLISEHSKWIL
jgi:hypothetical protein